MNLILGEHESQFLNKISKHEKVNSYKNDTNTQNLNIFDFKKIQLFFFQIRWICEIYYKKIIY